MEVEAEPRRPGFVITSSWSINSRYQLSAERLFLLALTVLCAISQLCAIEKDKQLTPPIFLLLLLLTLLLTHLVVIVLTVVIFLVLLVLLLLLVVVVVVRWGQKTNQPTDKAFLRVE